MTRRMNAAPTMTAPPMSVPIVPMAHEYLVTQPFRDRAEGHLPTLRDPDNLVYFREDQGILGYVYELDLSEREPDEENRAQHTADEPPECMSGLVLQGIKKPYECPAFGVRCTPEHPLGATMVSSEGTCAAYYQYRRRTH